MSKMELLKSLFTFDSLGTGTVMRPIYSTEKNEACIVLVDNGTETRTGFDERVAVPLVDRPISELDIEIVLIWALVSQKHKKYSERDMTVPYGDVIVHGMDLPEKITYLGRTYYTMAIEELGQQAWLLPSPEVLGVLVQKGTQHGLLAMTNNIVELDKKELLGR